MRRSTRWMIAGGLAGVGAAAATAYGLVVRPWHLSWGATREELEAEMPDDALVPNPNYFATRAISIAAPPGRVWPLLLDTRRMPRGTVIRSIDEQKSVSYAPPEVEAEATWVVTIRPERDGTTRLVSRNRARFRPYPGSVWRYMWIDPGQFVVERQWLLGLKKAAEKSTGW